MGRASRRPRRRARLKVSSAALAATAIAAAIALAPASAGARSVDAHAARTLSIKERASLRLHDKKGFVLKEQGVAKGTIGGEIYIQLKVSSRRTVTAVIQVYPSRKDALSATASATYRVVTSSAASFSGTLKITGGKGRYSKAKGSGLKFTGTVHRPSDSVSVSVSGSFSY